MVGRDAAGRTQRAYLLDELADDPFRVAIRVHVRGVYGVDATVPCRFQYREGLQIKTCYELHVDEEGPTTNLLFVKDPGLLEGSISTRMSAQSAMDATHVPLRISKGHSSELEKRLSVIHINLIGVIVAVLTMGTETRRPDLPSWRYSAWFCSDIMRRCWCWREPLGSTECLYIRLLPRFHSPT